MSKVSDALGMDMGEEPMPMSAEGTPEDVEPKGSASAEVLAMKQFDRATSPEDKAQAMKDFLEACGLY